MCKDPSVIYILIFPSGDFISADSFVADEHFFSNVIIILPSRIYRMTLISCFDKESSFAGRTLNFQQTG